MKILLIAENGRRAKNRHLFIHHSMAFWLENAGAKVEIWGPGHVLYKLPFNKVVQRNDIILCMENYDTGWLPDMSEVKKYKIFWSIDSHCVLNEHVSYCKKNKVNMLLNSTKAFLKDFDFVEKKVWFPNAIDHRHYKPYNIERKYDVGFCGSMIHDRKQWTDFVSKHFDTSVDQIIGDEMIERLNQYRVSINKSISIDINYRIFENLACKTPLVTNYVPDLEHMFTLDQDFLVYTNVKEMIGAIQILLSDEQLANEIAESGYRTVMSKHTFMHRCNQLYSMLEEI